MFYVNSALYFTYFDLIYSLHDFIKISRIYVLFVLKNLKLFSTISYKAIYDRIKIR